MVQITASPSAAQARVFRVCVAVGGAQFGDAAEADEALIEKRLVEDAHDRRAVVLERDQRSPQRLAGDEGARAVDRIEDPDETAVAGASSEFFAENAVIRICRGDQIAHHLLRRACRLR